MSQVQKLRERFLRKPPPTDFKWDELVRLLSQLDFAVYEKQGGSSHKHFQDDEGRIIEAARPHPNGIMKIYQMRQIAQRLEDWGLL